MRPHLFILEGRRAVPVHNVITWALWYERANRRVNFTRIGNIEISTVFLGLNYSYDPDDPRPLLFETMIFGGSLDGCQYRSSTWARAEKYHREVVALVKKSLPLERSKKMTRRLNRVGEKLKMKKLVSELF